MKRLYQKEYFKIHLKFLLFFNFSIFCSLSFAQLNLDSNSIVSTNSELVVIEDIRLEGLQRIEPGTVFSILDIKINDKVGKNKISSSIRELFDTGFFEDVEISLEKSTLVVTVVERPSIGGVEISGSKEFDEETLLSALKQIGLAESEIFDKLQYLYEINFSDNERT